MSAMSKHLSHHSGHAARRAWLVALALVGFWMSTATSFAQKAATEKWAVVRVDDEVRVIESSGVKDLRKSLDEEWKAATRQYAEARKQASKAKEEFTEPKPSKRVFKVLKDGFKSQELATAAREEWEVKLGVSAKEGSEGKEGKEGDEGKEGKESKEAAGGSGSFVVVQAGTQHQILDAALLKEFKQDVAARDKQALQDYAEAKKAAKQAKEPFEQKPPKKTQVKVLKKFPSEEAARAFLEKLKSEEGSKDG